MVTVIIAPTGNCVLCECMYVCEHARVFLRVHTCTRVSLGACVHMYTSMHTCFCTWVCVHALNICVRMQKQCTLNSSKDCLKTLPVLS